MKFFSNTVIKPYIVANNYRRLCEIGASRGENTDVLLELKSVTIDIIDPCLDANLCEKYAANARIKVHKGTSLEILQQLTASFDCILIDGDHNWFTVYNELKTIEERQLIRGGGTIFFHDVAWPYGRRDMYYRPEMIPQEFIHPYKRSGIVPGRSELSDLSVYNVTLCNASHEGGPRNGVLTAIEDFVNGNQSKYDFFYFQEEFGLGVLLKSGRSLDKILFNRYRLKAKYRSFRASARHRFAALHTSLKILKNKTVRSLSVR